jgi:hypothetical protein
MIIDFISNYTCRWVQVLRSFVKPPVTSSVFGPNILNTLFSNILSLCSSLINVRDPSYTPIQNHRQNYSFVYSNFYVFGQQTRRQKNHRKNHYVTKMNTKPRTWTDSLDKPTFGILTAAIIKCPIYWGNNTM